MQPPRLPSLFITGAHGYIGGAILTILKRSQPSILVRALVRDSAQADALGQFYGWTVTPVIGNLDNFDLLKREATEADIVIQATGGHNNNAVVGALIEGMSLNPKNSSEKLAERPIFLQISGSSNVSHPVLGENSPRVWSDIDDWDDILALEETRISVGTDNFVRRLSQEKDVRTLIVAPPTILGRGLGAGRTETHQRTMYDMILRNGAVFQAGDGANTWSTLSIEDLGRACVFLLEEAQKGDASRVQLGKNGYYFVEAFELSLAHRMEAVANRLYREGKIASSVVQSKSLDEIRSNFGDFAPYLWGSSSRIKADKLRALGWQPLDWDWLRMVQEAPGYRC